LRRFREEMDVPEIEQSIKEQTRLQRQGGFSERGRLWGRKEEASWKDPVSCRAALFCV